MKVFLCLTSILFLSSAVSCRNLNLILRSKMISSQPASGPTHLLSGVFAYGAFFSKTCHVNELETVVKTRAPATVIINGKKTVIQHLAFKKMEVLKYSTKFENIILEKNIVAGKRSAGMVNGYIGERVGTTVTLRSAHGAAKADAITPTNDVRYQKCKKVMFKKKCSWEIKKVPRGFNNQESLIIYNFLQHVAHMKAIAAIPLSLQGEGYFEETKNIGKDIVREVEVEHISDVVAILTEKRKEEIERLVAEGIKNGKFVVENHEIGTTFFIELRRVNNGKFDVFVNDLE